MLRKGRSGERWSRPWSANGVPEIFWITVSCRNGADISGERQVIGYGGLADAIAQAGSRTSRRGSVSFEQVDRIDAVSKEGVDFRVSS